MTSLNLPSTEKMARLLREFRPRQTISFCAGLLTIPAFHAATPRLDYLVHLAVMYCDGRRKPAVADLSRWLNRNLLDTPAWQAEDPPEDVFISNVSSNIGNCRIFQDTFPNNDYYLRTVLNSAEKLSEKVSELKAALDGVFALLRLSDHVCKRLSLPRWTSEASSSHSPVLLSPSTGVAARAEAVSFSSGELAEIGISMEMLAPFVLTMGHRESLLQSTDTHDSELRRHPLIQLDDDIILAMPNAVGNAARSHLLSIASQQGLGAIFTDIVATTQTRETLDCLSTLGVKIEHHRLDSKELPPMFSFEFGYEEGHFVHIVVLLEDAVAFAEEGEHSTASFTPSVQTAFNDFLVDMNHKIRAKLSFERGTSILVFGGLGRRREASIPFDEPDWDVIALDVPDILMLFSNGDREFRRFIKSREQLRWAESKGVEFMNPSGAFGHYCFWTESDYRVVPKYLPVRPGSNLMLLGDFLAKVRKKTRALDDFHVVQNRSGAWIDVARYGRDSYFSAHENIALYASPEAASNRILAGVVESNIGNRWLIFPATRLEENGRETAFYIWSNFINVFADLVFALDAALGDMPEHTIEIFVDVGHILDVNQEKSDTDEKSPFHATVQLRAKAAAQITLPPNFFEGFFRLDNAAERALLYRFGEAIWKAARSVGTGVTLDEVHRICNEVLPLGGGRLLHMFPSRSNVDHMLGDTIQKPTLIDKADMTFVRLGLGLDRVFDEPVKLVGKEDCKSFLNKLVANTWQEIQKKLKAIDCRSLVDAALRSNEAVFADQLQWRHSAQAVLSLHGRGNALTAAFKREQERSRTSLTTRILLEMGICECPKGEGRTITKSEHEKLLALAALIIEVASDSDAIHGGLTKPEVVIYPNGEYNIDRAYQRTIMRPFVSNQFSDDYLASAEEYHGYLKHSKADGVESSESRYSQLFADAFQAEYGLSPEDLIECFAELIDIGADLATVVVITTVGDIRARFRENRKLRPQVIDAFLKNFCLPSRLQWDRVPKGFRPQDTWPWLFRRRLSVVVRPVLLDGTSEDSHAYYGLAQLIQSWNYLLTRSEAGRLPQEFFVTSKMRAYAGHATNERGAAFEEETAALLREIGWEARTRVQMTELGGTQEQGDIDVLAWMPDGRILAIECKWLQPARTVGEVADVLAKFAGEEKDKLARHLARIDWLNKNSTGLRKTIKANSEQRLALFSLLVTDADVPMMYVEDLPIPAKDVMPIKRLSEVVSLTAKNS